MTAFAARPFAAAIAFAGLAAVQPAPVAAQDDCNPAKAGDELRAWIDSSHKPIRAKRNDVGRKWKDRVLALIEKRGLKDDAAREYALKLRKQVADANAAAMTPETQTKLRKLIALTIDASKVARQPAPTACTNASQIKTQMAALFETLDTQLDNDWRRADVVLTKEEEAAAK